VFLGELGWDTVVPGLHEAGEVGSIETNFRLKTNYFGEKKKRDERLGFQWPLYKTERKRGTQQVDHPLQVLKTDHHLRVRLSPRDRVC